MGGGIPKSVIGIPTGIAVRRGGAVWIASSTALGVVLAQKRLAKTFVVNVPAASKQRVEMELRGDRSTAACVRLGGFQANHARVTLRSFSECLDETASATAKRECEVSMANIEVGIVTLPDVRRFRRAPFSP
jgi:hypothetical protein